MDVRISQGIKLKEVPDKISGMLEEASVGEVDRMIDIAYELLDISDSNVEIVAILIENARKRISQVDRKLSDISMILAGYVSAQATLDEQTTQGEIDNAD